MRFLLLCLVPLIASGCGNAWRTNKSQAEADRNEYAREAYRQQHLKEKEGIDEPRMDQPSESDKLIQVTDVENSQWAKLHYETADEWLERMNALLRSQNDELISLQNKLNDVQETHESRVSAIQQLLQVRQQLHEEIAAREKAKQAEVAGEISTPNNQPAPDFFVHLVRPKDTLYSIAMHYYGKKEMVGEIMRWNERWVRNESDLIAGVGLILFPSNNEQPNPQVVEKFVEDVELPR